MGADTLQDILGAIRRAINYARRQRKIDRNEAEAVELPEVGVKPRDWDFLTQEQVETVLSSVEGTRMHALMVIGFECGLRPGELRALHWDDIDFRHQCLYVVRYLKGGVRSTSRREVPLSDRGVAALREHKENDWGGGDVIFVREDGQPYDKDGLRWRVEVVFRDAGLGQLDVYCMRHTFASVMDDRGVEHQTIADLMGHKNVKTFETIYRHRLRPVRVAKPNLMNSIWGTAA